jgi:hypothetical protein
MNRTHALVLSLLLLVSGFTLAQQNPPIAQPQPATREQPGVAQPAEAAVTNQDRAQIQSLVRQLGQAALNNDVAYFDQVLAPNYQAINAQGVKEDKNYILNAQRQNDIKYEAIDEREEDIRVSGDTAVERGTTDVKGVYRASVLTGPMRQRVTSSVNPTAPGRSSASKCTG